MWYLVKYFESVDCNPFWDKYINSILWNLPWLWSKIQSFWVKSSLTGKNFTVFESFVRSFWMIIKFSAVLATINDNNLSMCEPFSGMKEVVVKVTKNIQPWDQRKYLWLIESAIAETAAHIVPIRVFNTSIVITFIGTWSSVVNLVLLAEAHEAVIDKLTTAIKMELKPCERGTLTGRLDSVKDAVMPLTPDWQATYPKRIPVLKVGGINVRSRWFTTIMLNYISVDVTRFESGLRQHLYRNLFSQGRTPAPTWKVAVLRSQMPVNRKNAFHGRTTYL